MKRKILAVLSIVLILVSFISCSQEKGQTPSPEMAREIAESVEGAINVMDAIGSPVATLDPFRGVSSGSFVASFNEYKINGDYLATLKEALAGGKGSLEIDLGELFKLSGSVSGNATEEKGSLAFDLDMEALSKNYVLEMDFSSRYVNQADKLTLSADGHLDCIARDIYENGSLLSFDYSETLAIENGRSVRNVRLTNLVYKGVSYDAEAVMAIMNE